MKRLLTTNPGYWAPLIARVILGIVVFPHGAQKLLGWFGGYGFEGTMRFMTGPMKLPWIVGLSVILIESLGALALIGGFFTRFFGLCIFCNFLGIILHTQMGNGFFMNWDMLPDKPEGYEYHLLILGVSIELMISGGGRWSMDSLIVKHFFKTSQRIS